MYLKKKNGSNHLKIDTEIVYEKVGLGKIGEEDPGGTVFKI